MLQLARRSHTEVQGNPIETKLDVAKIYAQHSEFLWKSLFRMGIPEADLPDVLQEVLLVVHRRLESFDATCRLTTWLFGICLRVTATARRTRRRRREDPMDPSKQDQMQVQTTDPEDAMLARDAQRRLQSALDSLDPEKRTVFVMFELEGVSCADIADMLGVPKGTVFSRLASARHTFLAALSRLEKTEHRKSIAMGGQR